MGATGSVVIDGRRIVRGQGERSWTTGALLGSGGQGVVYTAREVTAAGNKVLEDLSIAISRISAIRDGGEDVHGNLAAALRNFMATSAEEGFVLKVYVPRDGLDASSAWRRSEAEVLALSRVSHPGIVRVEDSGVLTDDRRFVVFPRCRRGSLVAARPSYVGQPLGCLRAAAEIHDAVAHMHAAGFVHRDIKPENILVADDSRLVLADFGLVFDREREETLTRTGERVGNWQFGPDWGYVDEGHADDPRADLYAVAKVLWWLASGKPLLRREEWAATAFDLTRMFPNVPAMALVNEVLAKGLADAPDSVGYADANNMRTHIFSVIDEIETRRHSAVRPPAACRACQSGAYAKTSTPHRDALEQWRQHLNELSRVTRQPRALSFDVYRCSACGHIVCYATPSQPREEVLARVRELVLAGKTLDAIKTYRQQLGGTIGEARNAVREIGRS